MPSSDEINNEFQKMKGCLLGFINHALGKERNSSWRTIRPVTVAGDQIVNDQEEYMESYTLDRSDWRVDNDHENANNWWVIAGRRDE